MNEPLRSRTITWEDPVALRDRMATLGREALLNGAVNGTLRMPCNELLGIWIAAAGEGRAVATLEPAEYHCQGSAVV